jgi:glycosyltransferase involved in cell wall biosynthesis
LDLQKSTDATNDHELMRILHAYKTFYPDDHGGILEVIEQLAELRRLANDDVRILVARTKGCSREFTRKSIPVSAVASLGQVLSMPLAPTFPFALWRSAKRLDVLAVHSPFPLSDLGLALGMPKHLAIVQHWHAAAPHYPLISAAVLPYLRNTARRADRIIVSDASIIDGSDLLQEYAQKCVSIPYGIDVGFWSTLDDDERKQADSIRQQHPRFVVAVGRLVSYKGYPVLLEAMRQIDGELMVIGDGVEKDRLLRLANDLNIATRVKFLGFLPRNKIKLYYHSARAFVLASKTTAEAFGLVQVEAMAAGLPVVNTQLSTAVPKVARNGIEGLTVPPGDSHQLARAVNKLLDDRALADQMSIAARHRAEAQYSQSGFISKVRETYASALAERAN